MSVQDVHVSRDLTYLLRKERIEKKRRDEEAGLIGLSAP